MSTLNELAEQVATAISRTNVDDLPELAGIHSQLQELHARTEELKGQQGANAIRRSAAEVEGLIERIILRDNTDAAKSLEEVRRSVVRLQEMVRRAVEGLGDGGACNSGGEPPAADGASSATQPAKPSAPDNAPTDNTGAPTVISADDAPMVAEFIDEARGHIESAEAAALKVEEQPDDAEAINSIFRAFHTIKGVAGFLNLKQIGALAHAAENLLDLGRKGELKLAGGTVDVILESIDRMKMLLARLDEGMKENRPIAPDEALGALLERLRDCAAGKASAGASTSLPRPETPAGGDRPVSQGVGGAVAETTVKIGTERLDNLIDMVGELVIAESMVRQDVSGLIGGNQRLARNVSHLGKITRSLQELSMAMRMVPIHGVFQKMNRLVRDLARKAGKQIDFVMAGGETELDRNVVEAIGDPLVHMVRNSVDHGIESPEERQRAGKAPAGRVELKAYHQGGSIVIQISDDGRGLNKQKILKKALDSGLIKEGQDLSEQEIFALIFHAGLSTAEKVTEVSGRGVGMDVVRKNIEALRGRIEIASVEGQGATFTIKLPLTLAVIDGLVVKVGAERYILPMTSIEQSLRPSASQISTVQGRGEMCLIRGTLLPLYRLHRLFDVTPRTQDPTQALVVIVQDNQRRCCLLVDELLGQQQVVIKSLGERIGNIKGISGGAILGDGNVSLILDVPGLMDAAAFN